MMTKGSMKSKRCGEEKCNRFALGSKGKCKVHFYEKADTA